MKSEPSPCYYCNNHSAYCHSGCPDWTAWKQEHEKKRLEEAKRRKAEGERIEYRKSLHERLRRQAKYHKTVERKGRT